MEQSEHYKNNPNDKEMNLREKVMMGKIGQLRHKCKLSEIKKTIETEVLKTQIKSDHQIKETFIEMFPHEYRLALMESINRYGATKKKEVRRLEIINSLELKDPNILNKMMKKWKVPKDDTTL